MIEDKVDSDSGTAQTGTPNDEGQNEASAEAGSEQSAARPAPAPAEDVPATPPPEEAKGVEAEAQQEDPLETARAEARRTREQMLRIAADFDNFRKRARRETDDAARRAREDILRDLLPVFDNLERAVGHAEQATDAASVATGVKIVLKQFVDTLGRIGVSRINALGSPFDPNVHEAIQQLESADQSPGTVLAEVVPGYQWGDRLLRASMVVVAKAPPAPAQDAEPDPATPS